MEQTLDPLLELFEKFMMQETAISQYGSIGRTVLARKLAPQIEKGLPLDFVMLGFPMKSPNSRDKVIGKLPDLGEELSFRNFGRFAEKVKEQYKPGVNISIVSDGYVFSDIMEVEDRTVEAYEEASIDLARIAPINWFSLKDFYSSTSSISSMREKVTEQFGVSDTILDQRILMDPDVNAIYRGMIKFLTLDLAIKDFASNNQLQKAAKKVARQMMFRNEAYSSLIKKEFENSIRLSMHPSQNNGTKYSFQLIPSPKAWTSPWHCAIAMDTDGQYETIHRRDAIAAGYELIYENGRPYFFVQN